MPNNRNLATAGLDQLTEAGKSVSACDTVSVKQDCSNANTVLRLCMSS